MNTSLAECFIPRKGAARLRGRSPNSGSKPACEPQRAPPKCGGPPAWGFGPFGGLAVLALLLTSMLQPLHVAAATNACTDCSLKFQCGMSVATCDSGFPEGILNNNPSCQTVTNIDLKGYVVVMIDARNPALNAPGPNMNWPARMFHNECATNASDIWNAENLGEVFGITLDGETPPNIYVTATSIYVHDWFGPGGYGGVYKIDGSTFNIYPYVSLTNVGTVSLGNICYDKENKQFFVSELAGGTIRCVQGVSPYAGMEVSSYDHGVTGRMNAIPPLPQICEDNDTNTLSTFGRRVFGLQVYQDRLYYAVSSHNNNAVWSVKVVPGGVDPTSVSDGPRVEIDGTVLQTRPRLEEEFITSIAFSQDGKMLLGERGICFNGGLTNLQAFAHEARVHEFTNIAGIWTRTLPLPGYAIGMNNSGTSNSAGGVAYDCNGCIYATGDDLQDGVGLIYGLQILCPQCTNGVCVPCTNVECSYLIDFDCNLGGSAKTLIGAVAVYCCPAAEAIGCRVTGGSNHQLNNLHATAPCPVTTLPTHISHGGQVGAPFSVGTAFTPNSPCISGEWQHNRHYIGNSLVGTFHASGNGNVHQFDSLLCACLPCMEDPGAVGVVNGLCNPDRRICGPEPRRAPANKITFSGVGDYTFTNGRKTVPAVFRVDITDRSEGNSPSSAAPPDRYRFRAWLLDPLCPHPVGPMLLRLQASADPTQIGDLTTTEYLKVLPGGIAEIPPDIDDGGDMTQGNHQIHPATGAECGASMLAPAAGIDVAAEIAGHTPGGVGTFGTVAQGYQGLQDPTFVYRITITNSGTVTLRNLSVSESTDTAFEDTSRRYFVPGEKLPAGGSVTRYFTNILGMDTIYTATVTGESSQNADPVVAASTAMAMVRPAVTQPLLSIQAARPNGGQVQFTLQTESGVTSQVEYTESLSPPHWTALQTIVGNGSVVTVSDAITNAPQRFYRVRVE